MDPFATGKNRLRAVRGGLNSLLAFVIDAAGAERARWPLWLPVGLGVGIAFYFTLPEEPALGAGLVALGFCLLVGLVGYAARGSSRGQGALIIALAAGSIALGFSVATFHTQNVAAPVIGKRIGPVTVEGRIEAVEPGRRGARVTLGTLAVDRLNRAATPSRVRVRIGGDLSDVAIGTRLRLRAVLMPPPGPSAPGAFDFARKAWFLGIGAVGYAVSRPVILAEPAENGVGARLARSLAESRRALFRRIVTALPGETGGIAAALMTGERGAIDADAMEAMRGAGLAHLLAISGLHVGLVTGVLFFGLRAILALWERAALRWPIKKWAAAGALTGAFGYMVMTGATVPTQRAFLMAGLVLVAVMVDRAAISMRLVAWAAVAVLLIAPQSLMGPSFQMSFAAVVALIAVYELLQGRFGLLGDRGGLPRRFLVYFCGVALTTLVAGLATAPFALYHFNRFAVFGLAANLGAVPITAVWIMPWATLAYALAPFGLEGLALTPMGWGIDAVLAIARTIAGWPGAAVRFPVMPEWGLGLIAVGGLWLALWRLPWRSAGAVVLAGGLASLLFARPPDLVVAGDARAFAVLGATGGLVIRGDAGRFTRETWLRRAGYGASGADGEASALACDPQACVYRIGRTRISLIRDPGAAREDCRRADVVVALVPLRRIRCQGPRLVIGRFDLWREGAHALWVGPDGDLRLETAAEARGRRPWVPRRGGRR